MATSALGLSSLALSIFRMKYYDATNWPIHIPSMNEDSFLRRAYYGGHTDVYKPRGDNLDYYDVNSLYPFVMKEFARCGILKCAESGDSTERRGIKSLERSRRGEYS